MNIKRFSKCAVAAIIAVIMIVATCFTASAAVVAPDTTATTSITVNNVTNGDKFDIYKLFDVNYNAEDNTISYSWVDAVANAAGNKTVEEFAEQAGVTARQEYVQELISNLSSAEATGIVAADNKAVFDNMGFGGYVIVPTLSTSVYQVMVAVVAPTVAQGAWVDPAPVSIDVKKNDEPTITKDADKTNVGADTIITYTVEFDVPKYDGTVANPLLTLTDTGSEFLNYKGNLKVYVDGEEVDIDDVLLTPADIDEDSDDFGYVITLDFDYDAVKEGSKITVTYEAQITEDAPLKDDINSDATLEYTIYPYFDDATTNEVTDDVDVNTYGIKVFVYDETSTDETTYDGITGDQDVVPLGNAQFDIYAPDPNGITVPGIDEPVIKVGSIQTTEDGYASFDELPAGKYYLVETVAPNGYKKVNDPIEINFTPDDVDDQGYYNTAVGHKAGITLPQTGDLGAIVLTVLGVTLMLGAVAVLFAVRNKKNSAE